MAQLAGVGNAPDFAGGENSAVSGGALNEACDIDSGVGAGVQNVVGGGSATAAESSFIGGGGNNGIDAFSSIIGAGDDNDVSAQEAFLGAGSTTRCPPPGRS